MRIVAIDIGGTTTKIALVSEGRVCDGSFARIPTAARGGVEGYIAALAAYAAALHGRHGAAAIGLGVPGFADDRLERIAYAPNIPALVGLPLREALGRATGLPVSLEVDSNAAALAESRYGAGRGARRLLVLSLGTGVGGGFVAGGAVARVTGGCLGDLGHIYVGGARRCSAGCVGCLESAVSIEALAAEAGAAAEPGEAVRALVEAARAGEPAAAAILARAGARVGIAVASLSAFLQPDLVLLAGGISECGNVLAEAAGRAFAEHAGGYFDVPIRRGALGAAAPLVGAAAAAELAIGT